MSTTVLTYFDWQPLDTHWLGTYTLFNYTVELFADAGEAGVERFRAVANHLKYAVTLKNPNGDVVDKSEFVDLSNDYYSAEFYPMQVVSFLQELEEVLLVESAPLVPNLNPSPQLTRLLSLSNEYCDDEVIKILKSFTASDQQILGAVGVKPTLNDFWTDVALERINCYLDKHLPF